jgi:hypothetical protein
MANHADYHYSITIHTDDLAVLGCLRALSQFAQETGNVRIPWGGTKENDWVRMHHKATFRFSAAFKREKFLAETKRLLPESLWQFVSQRDDDPATPQDTN